MAGLSTYTDSHWNIERSNDCARLSPPEAGISGEAYVKLPKDLQRAVREDVRRSFPDGARRKPFVVEMEVLVGSGRE